MLDKFLEEVVVSIVGKPGEKLAGILYSKKHVNEFNISKKLDVTINQVRNYLYKLSDFGVVSSIRKKDKKKGWYTYFWRIEVLKALEFLQNVLTDKKGQLSEISDNRQKNEHYLCERCNLEFDEENALLMNFTCDECGGIFVIKDNTKLVKDLNKAVGDMGSKLVLVEKEIEKEKSRLDKIKEKEIKKIEKENEAKKLEKKLARQKLAKEKKEKEALSNKKDGKKEVSKKKVVSKKVDKKVVKKVVKKKETKVSKKK
jgi:transcription factor E